MTRMILLYLLLCLLCTPAAASAEESILLTGDLQMHLGDAFMAEGEYYRAVTEYKKYMTLFPDGIRSDAALYKIGMAYYRGLEYDSAAASFTLLRSRFPESRYSKEAAYQEGICYARLKNFDSAVNRLEIAASDKSDGDISSRARLLTSLVQFDRGDIPSSRKNLNLFLADFPDDARSVNVQNALSILKEAPDKPRKSPELAGVMSAVLPGSGHMYAGHYGDGATALLLNGLFIAGTVVAVQQENYAVAGIVGVIGLPFYIGNIYGAANAANKWNLGVRKGIRDSLALTLHVSY